MLQCSDMPVVTQLQRVPYLQCPIMGGPRLRGVAFVKPDFWLDRWQTGRTGFHRDAPLPWLMKHWPELDLPYGSRVLVPLCGKSLDLLWLAGQGHEVVGVELSEIAIRQFLDEHELDARIEQHPGGRHYHAGPFELICGDIFDQDADTLGACTSAYDRAALIALPPAMRERYAAHLDACLPAGCDMLLVTLDYDQQRMDGPPFAVGKDLVQQLYGKAWATEELECRDILADNPGFIDKGLDWLTTSTWRLQKQG